MKPSILVVDDDDILGERLQRALQRRGHTCFYASSPAQALEIARTESPDRAILDLRMPGGDGLTLQRDLRDLDATIEVVILTGYGSIANAVEAVRQGASGYVQKPAHADEILAAFTPGSIEPGEYTAPSLDRVEWEHINRVLTDCGGNISQAARVLGMHRRSLQRKLQRYPPRT